MLCDNDTVNVIEGSISQKSKCNVKSCNAHAKFMIFNDDGATKMSRLFFCSCAKHLPIAVRRAWVDNRANKERIDKKVRLKEKEKAKKLLGIT
jgi:hypothetical protein